MVSNKGNAKRIGPDQFPTQGRYGMGVIAWRLPDQEYVVGTMIGLLTHNGVLHFKEAASRLIKVTDAPSCGRTQKGTSIVDLKKGDEILEMSIPMDMLP